MATETGFREPLNLGKLRHSCQFTHLHYHSTNLQLLDQSFLRYRQPGLNTSSRNQLTITGTTVQPTIARIQSRLVPGAGLGPACRNDPARDFKSLVSTSFTTRAGRCAWRRGSESNRRPRLCRPLHDHSATPPKIATRKSKRESNAAAALLSLQSGAGKESRTPDLNLGKVALYQLSYSREK